MPTPHPLATVDTIAVKELPDTTSLPFPVSLH